MERRTFVKEGEDGVRCSQSCLGDPEKEQHSRRLGSDYGFKRVCLAPGALLIGRGVMTALTPPCWGRTCLMARSGG